MSTTAMNSASCQLRVGRFHLPGQHFLLTACSHERLPIFLDDCVARIVLDSARWLDQHGRIHLVAAIVMPDHVHLVAAAKKTPLPEVMHTLKSYSSHRIKHMLGLPGPIWQTGYHDQGIRDDSDLRTKVNYCLQNPVRAGLVDDFHHYPHWWCRWEV